MLILLEKNVCKDKTHLILVWKHKCCLYVIKLGRGKMSLRFHTKLKACDKCTDAIRQYHRDKQIIDYKQTIACPKCGAMYSRVR